MLHKLIVARNVLYHRRKMQIVEKHLLYFRKFRKLWITFHRSFFYFPEVLVFRFFERRKNPSRCRCLPYKKELSEICEAAAKNIKSDRKIQREEGYRYHGSS